MGEGRARRWLEAVWVFAHGARGGAGVRTGASGPEPEGFPNHIAEDFDVNGKAVIELMYRLSDDHGMMSMQLSQPNAAQRVPSTGVTETIGH